MLSASAYTGRVPQATIADVFCRPRCGSSLEANGSGPRCIGCQDTCQPADGAFDLVPPRPAAREREVWVSHKRGPRSPEEVVERFTGGFREGELAPRIRAVGGESYFRRFALFRRSQVRLVWGFGKPASNARLSTQTRV